MPRPTFLESSMDASQHYVYLYRDMLGNPIYVGYGRHARRSSAHIGTRAHNARLTTMLRQGFTLEVSGPFGSEQVARAVETALISALMRGNMLANKNEGRHSWRFRPLGVPQRFVDRLDMPVLCTHELGQVCQRFNGVIFVMISDQQLSDGRPGDVLANFPSDIEVASRMERWWQLAGRARRDWVSNPGESPGILVALGGTGDFRIVIASLEIDKNGWGDAVNKRVDGLVTVPHAPQLRALDSAKLRGRKIDTALELKFGSLRHQQFILFDRYGNWVAGGNKSLRAKK